MSYINTEHLARLILEYCDETMETPSLHGFATWVLDNNTAYQTRMDAQDKPKAHKHNGPHSSDDDCELDRQNV